MFLCFYNFNLLKIIFLWLRPVKSLGKRSSTSVVYIRFRFGVSMIMALWFVECTIIGCVGLLCVVLHVCGRFEGRAVGDPLHVAIYVIYGSRRSSGGVWLRGSSLGLPMSMACVCCSLWCMICLNDLWLSVSVVGDRLRYASLVTGLFSNW